MPGLRSYLRATPWCALFVCAVGMLGCGDAPTTATPTSEASRAEAARLAGTYEHTLPDKKVMTLELGADMRFKFIPSGPTKVSSGAYTIEGEKITLLVEKIDGKPVAQADRDHPIVLTQAGGSTLKGPGNLSFKKR